MTGDLIRKGNWNIEANIHTHRERATHHVNMIVENEEMHMQTKKYRTLPAHHQKVRVNHGTEFPSKPS
jgi:hypothetical protein